MGFLDKAKEAAEKAMAATQQAAQQGQHKIETMKEAKSEGELLKTLGEASYAEARHGGSHDAVDAAIVALDAHYASVAAATPPAADVPPAPAPAEPNGAAPAQSPPVQAPAAPAGNFTLDDM
jgi:hypothetical protein